MAEAVENAAEDSMLRGCDAASWRLGKEMSERVALVAAADKFARGGYPGPQPLPNRKNPWPEDSSATGSRSLAAIAAAVADFRVPLEERVSMMETWLISGEEPASYRGQVENERANLISALETGEIKVSSRSGGRIAVVYPAPGTSYIWGYCIAPVVVALNPKFRFGGGEPHRKFTVCQFTGGFVDLRAALTELAELETGWGGSPTIGGSPQGVSSFLTTDRVVEVLEKHLIG